MTDISRNWFDLSYESNILAQTYIKGFIDVSNNIVGQENLWIKNEKDVGDTRFGLGTLDPSATVHIMSDDPTIRITNSSVTSATQTNTNLSKIDFATPTFSGSTVTGYKTVARIRSENLESEYDYDGSLIFSTNNSSGNLTDRMVIRGNGDIGIGTSNPTSKLHVNGDITLTNGTFFGRGMVPVGGIITWSGTINNKSPKDVNNVVYSNWKVCDGSSHNAPNNAYSITVPNLTDKFIVSTGSSYTMGVTGGETSVTLSKDHIPRHKHTMESAGSHTHGVYIGTANDNYQDETSHIRGTGYADKRAGTGQGSTNSGSHTHYMGASGSSTNSHDNIPPYYALAYIMRIY